MKKEMFILVLLVILSVVFLTGGVSAEDNSTNQTGNQTANQSDLNQTIDAIKIIDIIPHEAPMLVPVNFVALIEGNGSYDYEWDFGDGGIETGSKKIEYTYLSLGLHEIGVKVSNSSDFSSKVIYVNVVSPVGSVNKTISDIKDKLDNIEEELNKLPDWVAGEVGSMIGLNELKVKVGEQENKTKDGVGEQEAIDIMEILHGLDIPERLGASLVINKVDFLINVGEIDLDVLKKAGAGDFKEEREKYDKSIESWVKENLDLKVESKSYKIYYEDREEDLVSYIKINLIPKKNLNKIYLVVNGAVNDGSFQKYGESRAKAFSDLKNGEVKNIEFLVPEKISIQNIPVYISPNEDELNLDVSVEICDNDGICESGEDYGNCKNDCKRWIGSGLMLIVLLIVAFIVYIILQEWYKLYYERSLFSDKNQLFNLVHFMNNSLNQGLSQGNIFNKLKETGWDGEQLNYAWKKLKGQRTGMWEVPIFKWAENRKVKAELEKRGGKIGYREFRVKRGM